MTRRRTVELVVLLVVVAALRARESSPGAKVGVYCVPTRAAVGWNNMSLPASSEFTNASLRLADEGKGSAVGAKVVPGDPTPQYLSLIHI